MYGSNVRVLTEERTERWTDTTKCIIYPVWRSIIMLLDPKDINPKINDKPSEPLMAAGPPLALALLMGIVCVNMTTPRSSELYPARRPMVLGY